MAIIREQITVSPTSGGAGLSTANNTSLHIIKGHVRAVHVAYLDSPPATTDVTIEGVATPKAAILTLANANTDGWFYPMGQAKNPAGVDIAGQGAPLPIDDQVKVTVAQANDGDGVTVTLLVDDGQ